MTPDKIKVLTEINPVWIEQLVSDLMNPRRHIGALVRKRKKDANVEI